MTASCKKLKVLSVSVPASVSEEAYPLLDLCSVTDTLIGDEDGLYHPGLFIDCLLLGLIGTMAEAEMDVICARLKGGIHNKATQGELRRGLPVGFIWGEHDGEVLMHPDQAVTRAIHTVFEKICINGICPTSMAVVPIKKTSVSVANKYVDTTSRVR